MKNYSVCIKLSAWVLLSLVFVDKNYAQKVNNNAPAKCLIISDIHFNPLYGTPSDMSLKAKLANASVSEWKGYFEHSAPQMAINANLLYQDANYGILKSAIANMKKQLPNPAFIVIAGDFIWHGAKPADADLKKKCIQFIAQLFKENFPGVPIIPAMGNNDTYGDDYAIQDTRFLNDFADAWEPNLPKASDDSLKVQGYYSYQRGDLKLIVINSAVLNRGSHYALQAIGMLKWLQNNLADPRCKNAWIIMHIPPGTNVYSGAGFWNPDYTGTFINTVVKYSSKVRLGIASHTHFNDFRVFYNAGKKPVAFMRIVPSICSNHGNNPSFEVAEFSKTSGVLTNETNYYLNVAAITKDKTVAQANWNETISSSAMVKPGKIDAQGFSRFMDEIKNDKSWQLLTGYTRFYTVGTKVDSSIRVSRTNYMKYLKADSLRAN